MISGAKITHKMMMPEGLYLQLFVPLSTKDYFMQRKMEECEIIWTEDNSITAKQREKIYATLKDMGDYLGYTQKEVKAIFKQSFMELKGLDNLSFKDCNRDIAADFIDYILEQCFIMNVPLQEEYGINRAYNITSYLRLCIKYRKCCVCGLKADLHHEDAIGAGRNRRKVDDSKMRKMSLCRCHHTERHTIGETAFCEKYHVYGIQYTETEDDKFWNLVNEEEESYED